MPTRKISEREKLTIYARTASDDELDQALEILQVEKRVRGARKPIAAKPRQRTVRPVPDNNPKEENQ